MLVHWQGSGSCVKGAALSRGFWAYCAMKDETGGASSHGRDTKNWSKIA